MIVLNGKRIALVLSSIFLSILVFMFSFENNGEKDPYISTVSLPVSGKTIVVDAGHGVPDERCRVKQWNYRSGDKFKNCIKAAKFIRTKWMYGNPYPFR